LKKIFLSFCFLIVIFCCTHREITKKDEKIEMINENDIIKIYYRLVEGIKNRSMEQILSCYSTESTYQYSKLTGENFVCYNDLKEVSNISQIKENYLYLFKKKRYDLIEYEIVSIDKNKNEPKIVFINAWENSDYDHYEIISFVLENEKYLINRHSIVKREELKK